MKVLQKQKHQIKKIKNFNKSNKLKYIKRQNIFTVNQSKNTLKEHSGKIISKIRWLIQRAQQLHRFELILIEGEISHWKTHLSLSRRKSKRQRKRKYFQMSRDMECRVEFFKNTDDRTPRRRAQEKLKGGSVYFLK